MEELKKDLIVILVLIGLGFIWWVGYHEALHDNVFINWLDNA